MCSPSHPNWVTFDDDTAAFQSPQKPLHSPSTSIGIPRPNGLKLNLPPRYEPAKRSPSTSSSPLASPLRDFNGSPCVPSNTPLCTPVREAPGNPCTPFSSVYSQHGFFRSLSSPSSNPLLSPAVELAANPCHRPDLHTADPGTLSAAQSLFIAEERFHPFLDDSGHSNPFWPNRNQSGSSSSDSEPNSAETSDAHPHFFFRKEGYDSPGSHIHQSFDYICQKLESFQASDAEERDGSAPEKPVQGQSGIPTFIPRGLFRSQNRDGWPLMLRIPEKKNRMSSRQWGPIYLKLLPGGVLQMYYEKGLEKPFKEFQLHPYCRLSEPKLENCNEPGKIHTVKIQHVSYTEKRKCHPKGHEAETEQMLKLGTTDYSDFTDLLSSIEEELMRLPLHSHQKKHYEEQALGLEIVDNFWGRLGKDGKVVENAVVTHVYCLSFVNGGAECFLTLNDLQLHRGNPSYAEETGEGWIEISEYYFHKCVKENEFQKSRLIKFSPPDACRVELMRFKTLSVDAELPFSVKAVLTVQGAYVELQAFLNMSPAFTHSLRQDSAQVCQNVLVQVPLPGDWIKVSRTVSLLRQKSLKAKMNRNACLGSVTTADSEPVMQVTVGTVKYENAYGAIVWRIDRLPAKNTASDHPLCFSCKLELGSDQEIPSDWLPFVTMEFDVADTAASGTQVKSLGTESDIQPQKHIVTKAHYHCQPKLYRSIIEDVIESVREIFADEGVEEQVLKDLQKMWESKIMQSKAVEGFVKDTLNPSNFVLQLPANFSQALQKTGLNFLLLLSVFLTNVSYSLLCILNDMCTTDSPRMDLKEIILLLVTLLLHALIFVHFVQFEESLWPLLFESSVSLEDTGQCFSN
ncbi:stonin-1 [Huso huso]|uniref:Stonin-1 n=1 Tax=Huso huso TaxID=61971 RepID=A0ABR0ZX53_HUSHU